MKKIHYVSDLKFYLISLLIISAKSAIGQGVPGPDYKWQNAIIPAQASVINNGGNDITTLTSGSVITVGRSRSNPPSGSYYDVAVIKYAPDGSLLNSYYVDFYGYYWTSEAIKVKIRNNVVYVLITAQDTSGQFYDADIGVIKLDSNLNYLASYSFNSPLGIEEWPVDMGFDQAGNIYFTGWAERPLTGRDVLLVKLNSNLNFVWAKYYTSTGNNMDMPSAMVVQNNGNCNIVGMKTNTTKGSQFCLLRYSTGGNLMWQDNYNLPNSLNGDDNGVDLSVDPSSGDVFATGKCGSEWVIIKYNNSNGSRVWVKRIAPAGKNCDPKAIAYIHGNALYSCASLTYSDGGESVSDLQVRKLNPSTGSVIWTRTYDGQAPSMYDSDGLSSMVINSTQEIFLIGRTATYLNNTHERFMLVLKYDSLGNILWTSTLGPTFPANASSNGKRGCFNENIQSLYVVGTSGSTMSGSYSWTTTRFAPATSPLSNGELRSGIQSNKKNSYLGFSVFPNPADGIISLESNEEGVQELVITDVTGKVVFSESYLAFPVRIDCSGWMDGIYFISAKLNDDIVTEKLVKY